MPRNIITMLMFASEDALRTPRGADQVFWVAGYDSAPTSFEWPVDLLVAGLLSWGGFRTGYAPGPPRQKRSGSARLPDRHPAATHRFSAAPVLKAAESSDYTTF